MLAEFSYIEVYGTALHRAFGRHVGFDAEDNRYRPIPYWWSQQGGTLKVYGLVEEESIKEVEVELLDGTKQSQATISDDIFFMILETEVESAWIACIRGYDESGQLLYEIEY